MVIEFQTERKTQHVFAKERYKLKDASKNSSNTRVIHEMSGVAEFATKDNYT